MKYQACTTTGLLIIILDTKIDMLYIYSSEAQTNGKHRELHILYIYILLMKDGMSMKQTDAAFPRFSFITGIYGSRTVLANFTSLRCSQDI